jgi:hypothetical protein
LHCILWISGFARPERSELATHFPRDFLLVWDWNQPLEESQGRKEYKTLTKTNTRELKYSKIELEGYLEIPTRIWNVVLILGDLEEYEKAEGRLREAIEGYEMAIGKSTV